MKTLKEKILRLPNAKEVYIMKQYSDIAGINIWEEYNEMGYEIEEIMEHILDALIEKNLIPEWRRMMQDLSIKNRTKLEEDKNLSFKLMNYAQD